MSARSPDRANAHTLAVSRMLLRALAVKRGRAALCKVLDVSVSDFEAWIGGREPPPRKVLTEASEIIASASQGQPRETAGDDRK